MRKPVCACALSVGQVSSAAACGAMQDGDDEDSEVLNDVRMLDLSDDPLDSIWVDVPVEGLHSHLSLNSWDCAPSVQPWCFLSLLLVCHRMLDAF